jgi:hypothetical protein
MDMDGRGGGRVNKSGSRGTLMGPVRAPVGAGTHLVRVPLDPDVRPMRGTHAWGADVHAPHRTIVTVKGVPDGTHAWPHGR